MQAIGSIDCLFHPGEGPGRGHVAESAITCYRHPHHGMKVPLGVGETQPKEAAMSKSFAVALVLSAALATPISASALDIRKIDGVVFMSGQLGPKDRSALEKALVGSRALVIGQVAPAMADNLQDFAVLIHDSAVPTVVNGQCGADCAYVFMAGRQRLFGASTPKKPTMVLISTIGVRARDGTMTPWLGNYPLLSARFGEAMPRELLRKYAENAKFPEGMLAFPPSPGYPEGAFLACRDVRDSTTCTIHEQLTPVNTGMVSSAEPFPIPSR